MGHRFGARVPTLLALVLAAGMVGCDDGTTIGDGFELSGRVEELIGPDQTGDAIEGARVTFRSDTLIVEETTSDSGGRYRMRISTDYPFGQVRAEADGFLPDEETVFFDVPQRRVDLQMRSTGSMMME